MGGTLARQSETTATGNFRSNGCRPASAAGGQQLPPAETRRDYADDWKQLGEWALAHGVCPLPCSTETLTKYVTCLTVTPRERTHRPYKPAPIEHAMASTTAAHKTTGARLLLKGYEYELR